VVGVVITRPDLFVDLRLAGLDHAGVSEPEVLPFRHGAKVPTASSAGIGGPGQAVGAPDSHSRYRAGLR
jgi:hypothetical protein